MKWKMWSPLRGARGGVREEFLGRQARFGGRKAVAGCGMRRVTKAGALEGVESSEEEMGMREKRSV